MNWIFIPLKDVEIPLNLYMFVGFFSQNHLLKRLSFLQSMFWDSLKLRWAVPVWTYFLASIIAIKSNWKTYIKSWLINEFLLYFHFKKHFSMIYSENTLSALMCKCWGGKTALVKETAFFNNIENTFQLEHIAVVKCFYVILETLGSIPRIQLMKKQGNKGRKGEGRKERKTGVDCLLHFSSTFFIYYKSRNHIFSE